VCGKGIEMVKEVRFDGFEYALYQQFKSDPKVKKKLLREALERDDLEKRVASNYKLRQYTNIEKKAVVGRALFDLKRLVSTKEINLFVTTKFGFMGINVPNTLTSLQNDGYIKSIKKGRLKYWKLTETGELFFTH
jgi:hypothetical protein